MCHGACVWIELEKERAKLWQELSLLRNSTIGPFLFIGDFNEVLQINERRSGAGNQGSIDEFAQWVQELGSIDIPLIGRKYTWSRCNAQSRLDRALVEVEWTLKYPEMKLWALNKVVSDHCSLRHSLWIGDLNLLGLLILSLLTLGLSNW